MLGQLGPEVMYAIQMGGRILESLAVKRVATDPPKVAMVKDWPTPRNGKKVNSFFG